MLWVKLLTNFQRPSFMQNDAAIKHYTRGGQISFHNLRMWDQITKTLSIICLCLWTIISTLLIWLNTTKESLQHIFYYFSAFICKSIGLQKTFSLSFNGVIYKQSTIDLLQYPYYLGEVKQVGQLILTAFMLALWLGFLLAIYFIKRGKKQSAPQFVRGSVFAASKKVKQLIKKQNMHSDLNIDGFPLIKNSEVQHLLVHGTVGTGKSQLIMKLLDCLKGRGDRVILYDKGCSFTPYYYEENKDVLLNPFDIRCPNWDLWSEAPQDADFENIAESLIPAEGQSDPFWINAARTVFTNAASRMRNEKDCSLNKLLTLLLKEPLDKLESYLQGMPAASLINTKTEKMAMSIRSVMNTYLQSLLTLNGLESTLPLIPPPPTSRGSSAGS